MSPNSPTKKCIRCGVDGFTNEQLKNGFCPRCTANSETLKAEEKAYQESQSAKKARPTKEDLERIRKNKNRVTFSAFIRVGMSDLYDWNPGVRATLREIAFMQMTIG